MKNKKVMMPIIIGIIILLIVILVVIMVLKNEEKPNTPSDNSSTTTTTKSSVKIDPEIYASVFMASFNKFNTCNTGYEFDFSTKNTLYFKDLKDEFIYNTIYNYLSVQNKIDIKTNGSNEAIISETNPREETIKVSDFQSALEILYGKNGKDYSLPSSFNIGTYKYDKVNDTYHIVKTSSPNCVGANKISSVKVLDEIEEKEISLSYLIYYSMYEVEEGKLVEYAVTNFETKEKICAASKVTDEAYVANFKKIKFTFTFDDELYVFDHVSLVK